MAGTITWEQLRELAGFRAEKGAAVSLYVDLDPSAVPTPPDVQTKVNSLLAEAEKQLGERRSDLERDGREALKADLGRITAWFDDGFDRQGARGLAIFAAGLDNFWSTLALSETVADRVTIGPELYVAPLARLSSRGQGALVAYVGRERGQVFRLQGGRLEEIADLTEDMPNQHQQGGWSQARYERSVENAVGQHLRDVAGTLDRCVRRLRGVPVVLVGPEETRSEFEALVAHDVKDVIAGWAAAEAHADATHLLAAAQPVVDAWCAARDEEVLARWREEAGRNGRATSGWEQTLEAVSDGRVDLLLVHDGVQQPAYQCPACGRAQMTDGSCPLDGTTLEWREDGLDLAVHRTLAHGGTVHVLRERPDLQPVGGIAALLRF